MKSFKIITCHAVIVASKLINSLFNDNRTNYYGEKCSNYFTLFEHENKRVLVAITLEIDLIDSYRRLSIHCINHVSGDLNSVSHIDDVSVSLLSEALKDIAAKTLLNSELDTKDKKSA